MSAMTIRRRDRDAILQSLAAGVVPRRGHQYIQVGRAEEVNAVIADLQRIVDGGSSVRFVIGEYGAGKSFFLQLARSIALEKGLVTMHADLTPDRRLHATGGQGRMLYAELARNMATRSSAEGGALKSVVERFVTSAMQKASSMRRSPQEIIDERLECLTEMLGGYDFAAVIGAYWRGYEQGDVGLTEAAVRWLRGEYSTKTDARVDLGVRAIVDDANVYDHLKLMARFVVLAGYSGLMVCMDEMVNLYKLASTVARRGNYEQLLRIVNDCLQGGVEYVGFVMGGTPEFLTDTRRGLYSYEALQSRLVENAFAAGELRDLSGPVIRLANLTPEELYVLLEKLRDVQASGEPNAYLLPDDGLRAFMDRSAERLGDTYFRTPRTTIKAFVQLLAVLEQNAQVDWRSLIGEAQIEKDRGAESDLVPEQEAGSQDADEELASFQL
jgi:bacteriophage exclusion system BrxC/D-like protein